jgi:hypothetical protein
MNLLVVAVTVIIISISMQQAVNASDSHSFGQAKANLL